jgi:hypothetical protein
MNGKENKLEGLEQGNKKRFSTAQPFAGIKRRECDGWLPGGLYGESNRNYYG